MPDTIHGYAPLWGVWHIQEAFTEGSWGTIYKIYRDAGGRRAYALAACVFIPNSASRVYDGNAQRGVLLELQDLQALNGSPNIVRLDEFSMHPRRDGEGFDLIVRMEYLLGFVQYKNANALSHKDCLVLGLHICYALSQCGGVHGDIRPENIFLSPNGNYKLGCFPLAFQKARGRKGAPAHTLLYASPELYKGLPLQRSADVYSLGLLLYSQLNADKSPFLEAGGREDRAVRLRLKGRDFPPPGLVDVRLASVLMQATAHDPLDRYLTAGDLEKAPLPCVFPGANPSAYIRSHDIPKATVTTAQKKRRPVALAHMLIICVAAGILLLGDWGIGKGGEAAGTPTPASLTARFSHSTAPQAEGTPAQETTRPSVSPTETPPASSSPAFVEADAQPGAPVFVPDQPIANRRGNSAGNLANGGIVARQGEWIYFAGYGGGIYKMGPEGDMPIPVLEGCGATHLNITGAHLYFINLTDGGRIYRVRTDGVTPEALTDTGASSLFVEDDTLYYTDLERGNLYRMGAHGNAKTRLSEDECLCVNVEKGWIYYRNGSEGDSLYSIRTDGSGRARVSGDRSAYLAVSEGWAFYNNVARHDYLYKVMSDGTNKARVNNDNTAHINASDGFVYYACLNKRGALYRVGVNGGSKQELSADDCISIQIAGKWVYYRNRSDGYALYRVRMDGSGREKISSKK